MSFCMLSKCYLLLLLLLFQEYLDANLLDEWQNEATSMPSF
jgi:hypothetical protein